MGANNISPLANYYQPSQQVTALVRLFSMIANILQLLYMGTPSSQSLYGGSSPYNSSAQSGGGYGKPFAQQAQSMAQQGRSQLLRSSALSTAQSSANLQGDPSSNAGGPSQIMDLSRFNLMLPTGQPGSPDIIKGDKLASYKSEYFQLSNGQMKFFAPVNGVHSANSEDPRSELGQTQGWKMSSGRHTLSASLTLDQVPSSGQVTIGQVHQRGGAGHPPIMISWKNGQVIASVMETNSPSTKRKQYVLAENVPKGQKINYNVDVAPDGSVGIDVNGKKTNFKMDSSFNQGEMYFKAGLYVHDNQGNSAEGARATFTGLQMT